ncbi:hypothetical protein MVES1_001712 [Malassezia vespertilionis]|uniref:uncharacterized protein n=1 Tax=Malassezia vespertilionis TaxID=2020962 RepID=UPI0024B1CBDF|nr:uncharacterized protein MVES1_001712 [Malassezia vespertilionis]WFD06367.1 hypothetical protein MVES1_001712 [Malassezia vespertilionis]
MALAEADYAMDDVEDESQPDYAEGEPEFGTQSEDSEGVSDVYESHEEDELVDEMEDAPTPETNRKSRGKTLRVRLSRSKSSTDSTPQSTPSRRLSGRLPKRTMLARAAQDSEEDDDELDDSDDSEMERSSDAPMTARQVARLNKQRGVATQELVELPMEDRSKRAKLTETELALRRSETARRRRNQSEKKLEDDKIETINRLLKKQVGKVRSGKHQTDDELHADAPRDMRANYPLPMFRYISRAENSVLAVPLAEDGREGAYAHALRSAFGQYDARAAV